MSKSGLAFYMFREGKDNYRYYQIPCFEILVRNLNLDLFKPVQ